MYGILESEKFMLVESEIWESFVCGKWNLGLWNPEYNQGAKKIIFTACPSGKLKLAFTSPDVISTSPKNFLFFCYSNSS